MNSFCSFGHPLPKRCTSIQLCFVATSDVTDRRALDSLLYFPSYWTVWNQFDVKWIHTHHTDMALETGISGPKEPMAHAPVAQNAEGGRKWMWAPILWTKYGDVHTGSDVTAVYCSQILEQHRLRTPHSVCQTTIHNTAQKTHRRIMIISTFHGPYKFLRCLTNTNCKLISFFHTLESFQESSGRLRFNSTMQQAIIKPLAIHSRY